MHKCSAEFPGELLKYELVCSYGSQVSFSKNGREGKEEKTYQSTDTCIHLCN